MGKQKNSQIVETAKEARGAELGPTVRWALHPEFRRNPSINALRFSVPRGTWLPNCIGSRSQQAMLPLRQHGSITRSA
jgi:hypothetical protein